MIENELVIDGFAGGGGASTGIEMALGVSPDIAINHDAEAIALHEANHPGTQHFISDIHEVDIAKACKGRAVGLAWLSPDCKHFSKAKGSKPVSCDIRSLAWVAIKWAKAVRPRIFFLENVEEFQDWGPICDKQLPIKEKRGETFKQFVQAFKDLGYVIEWKELRASDYGAPTIRKRLFIVARCDGMPIVFPEPTHGDPKKYPDRLAWKTAAECIDWKVPAHSIFLDKEEGRKVGVRRPLAENTMKRIAKGMKKFVIDSAEPFIMQNMHNNTPRFTSEPFATLLTGSHLYLVTPFVTEHANGSCQRNMPLDEPLRTICANVKGGHFALVAAFIAQHNLGSVGHDPRKPLSTITQTGSQQQIVQAYMMKYYGVGEGQRVTEPTHTITTRDRFAIIEVHGTRYEVIDICMRMFTPRELYTAQGFPKDYKINIEFNGKKLSKAAQVRMCGNSVVPVMAKLLVEANFMTSDIQKVG